MMYLPGTRRVCAFSLWHLLYIPFLAHPDFPDTIRYLEPHLTRRELVAELDYGQRTLGSAVISANGFYNMINTLRRHCAEA